MDIYPILISLRMEPLPVPIWNTDVFVRDAIISVLVLYYILHYKNYIPRTKQSLLGQYQSMGIWIIEKK